MKSQTIISMGPAIADSGMPVEHHAFDAQGFEPSCSHEAAIDDVRHFLSTEIRLIRKARLTMYRRRQS